MGLGERVEALGGPTYSMNGRSRVRRAGATRVQPRRRLNWGRCAKPSGVGSRLDQTRGASKRPRNSAGRWACDRGDGLGERAELAKSEIYPDPNLASSCMVCNTGIRWPVRCRYVAICTRHPTLPATTASAPVATIADALAVPSVSAMSGCSRL